jgi:hypothetical protein
MKVGDRVKHKTRKNVTGIVVSFRKHDAVMVDLSDKTGIMFRKFKIKSLEVTSERN